GRLLHRRRAVTEIAAAEPVLVCDGLTVEFGGVHALRDVSLELLRGEIVAVIGPNGAGKTTLLNAISAVVPTSRGTSRLTAKPTAHDPVSFARAGVGRSFQDPHLIDNATVLENVLIGAHAVHRRSIAGQVLRPLATYRHER